MPVAVTEGSIGIVVWVLTLLLLLITFVLWLCYGEKICLLGELTASTKQNMVPLPAQEMVLTLFSLLILLCF